MIEEFLSQFSAVQKECSVITPDDLREKLPIPQPLAPANSEPLYPNLMKQPLEQPHSALRAPKFSVYSKFTFKTDFFRCMFCDLANFVPISGIPEG